MSVRCAGCGLRVRGQRGLPGLCRRAAPGAGRYLRMLAEVPQVPPAARRLLDHGTTTARSSPSFSDGGYSRYFTEHFMLPLVAAVWSCPPGRRWRYPARYLFAFLANHGMLSVTGSPQWRTVVGGSRRYVEPAAKGLTAMPAVDAGRAVRRTADGEEVATRDGQVHRFDAVVIATHPDQALRLLDRRPPRPSARCSAPSLLPEPHPAAHRRRRCCPAARRPGLVELPAQRRAAGRARRAHQLRPEPAAAPGRPRGLHRDAERHRDRAVDPSPVIDRMVYEHPVYTPEPRSRRSAGCPG